MKEQRAGFTLDVAALTYRGDRVALVPNHSLLYAKREESKPVRVDYSISINAPQVADFAEFSSKLKSAL